MPPKRPDLKLGASAFTVPPVAPSRQTPATLLDSHVHLWTTTELRRMPWTKSLDDGDPRKEEYTLERYTETVHRYRHGKAPAFDGFVYVQVEVDPDYAVEEIDHVLSLASAASSSVVGLRALVPWAPVHEGPAAVEDHLSKLYALPNLITFAASSLSLERQAELPVPGATPSVIKGFRYILEHAPPSGMLQPALIDALRSLGTKKLLFEICVNSTTQGPQVLDDVLECITRVREGQPEDARTRFVIDHLAKPDLATAVSSPLYTRGASFTDFTSRIFEFALLPDVSIKLSGLLSQADPQLVQTAFAEWISRRSELAAEGYVSPVKPSGGHLDALKKAIQVFIEPVLDSFGVERILFASDFPIYTSALFPPVSPSGASPALERAGFEFAVAIYVDVLVGLGLAGEELDAIFAGNARRVYGL